MELVLTATLISVFASLTPGPDILLTVFNSLRFGFRHGVATTMGILCGVSLHLSAGILGISWLITHNPQAMRLINLAGGGWLLYIGSRGLYLAWRNRPNHPALPQSQPDGSSAVRSAWLQGFLVNLLNAKAFLYFLSLFSVLIGPEVPLRLRAACALAILLGQGAAFCSVAWLISHPRFRALWLRGQGILEVIVCCALALLGAAMWLNLLK